MQGSLPFQTKSEKSIRADDLMQVEQSLLSCFLLKLDHDYLIAVVMPNCEHKFDRQSIKQVAFHDEGTLEAAKAATDVILGDQTNS